MAGIRVHELAKEFGMSSKDLLVRLEEMKIPAKGHSSTLVDAYVDKIRKMLGPEVAGKQEEALAAKKVEAAARVIAERERREVEKAERAVAAEKERAIREEERALKTGEPAAKALEELEELEVQEEPKSSASETAAVKGSALRTPSIRLTIVETPAVEPPAAETPLVEPQLVETPATETPAVETKKPEPQRAEHPAEVAQKTETQKTEALELQATETQESSTGAEVQDDKNVGAKAVSEDAREATQKGTNKLADKKTAQQKKKPTFSGLLSQIEAEQSRIEAEKASLKEARKAKASGGASAASKTSKPAKKDDGVKAEADQDSALQQKATKNESGDTADTEGEARGGRKGKGRKGHQAGEHGHEESANRSRKAKDSRKQIDLQITDVYEEDEPSADDRYKQMALAAEQLQREKVLAEARAAVKAADDEGGGRRKKRKEKRVAEAKEKAELDAIERGLDPDIVLDSSIAEIPTGATVQEFSDVLGVASGDVVKRLFLMGTPLTVTQTMSNDLIELIAVDLDRKVRVVSPEEEYAVQINDAPENLVPRPPVVTVMGHVDHGKTSLLDAIRETKVITTEAGGITQHIGASVASINGRQITFIDTPGHEAFTAMRARGAKVTDVVVLVVAADDGVMPQTVEAIAHAKAAGVPIVVAINKIDKPGATPDRARQELTDRGIIPEEWGGQNMFVEVSAKKRINIDELLEAIILQADVLELKANPNALASGFVIESKLDKGRGPVATVLVQRGTLKVGDTVVMGTSYGRVRALINPLFENITEALPSDPVEILGLNSVPDAGDDFRVFAEEREARHLAEDRSLRQRMAEQQNKSRVTLENLFSHIEQDKLSELNLIVKVDVQGSIEALKDALEKMDQSEVRINVIHAAVGGITETDVTLATASNAVIIGFNVRPTVKAKQMADREEVEIKTYKIIYQAIADINAARVGLLAPDIVEEGTGMAEIRETFKVPKLGTIAGCMVEEGEISRDDEIRIVRDGVVIHEGRIGSLRRFKDDVKSVRAGYECGIGVDGYQDIKVGDLLETFRKREVAREA